jgi:FkbM family methyltransferase
MDAGLERLKKQVGAIGTVIDVGASNGMWTRQALTHFPESEYFLIEAKKEHEEELIKLQNEINMKYVIAAAGDKKGEAYFQVEEDVSDLFGGRASRNPIAAHTRMVPMVTINDCVKQFGLKPPYMIKLDTHGFEVQIIEGADEILNDTSALVIEVYSVKFHDECLTFPDMCKFLEQKGFRCVGIADPLNRVYDGALWQMDFMFVKADHPIFNYFGYSHEDESKNQYK